MATEITAEIVTGDEEEVPGPCEEYVPGRHDSVFNASTGTLRAVRLCKTCEYQEGDHEEPADSDRRTIVPDAPVDATDASPVLQSDEETARETVNSFMGGPPESYLPRVWDQLVRHLGRIPNQWEWRAVRRYLASVTMDMLTEATR